MDTETLDTITSPLANMTTSPSPQLSYGTIRVLTDHKSQLMVRYQSSLYETYPEMATFGKFLELDGMHVCVRAEITTPECRDWERVYPRGGGEYTEYWGWIPLSYFMGKREGDTTELTLQGKTYILTCTDRLKRRKFEDAIYHMTSSFGGIHCDTNNEPCRLEQMMHLYKAHLAYCESIGMTPEKDEKKFDHYM
jgi:hypothetical protein